MKRRDILRGISGGVGMATLPGIGSTSNVATHNNDFPLINGVSVETLSGLNRRKVFQKMKSSPGIQSIVDELQSRGWEPQWEEATVKRTTEKKSGSYDSCVVPFNSNGIKKGNDEVVMGWIGNETFDIDVPTKSFAHILERDPATDGGFIGATSAKSLAVENDRASTQSIDLLPSGNEIGTTANNQPIIERELQTDFEPGFGTDTVVTGDPPLLVCGESKYMPDCGGGGNPGECAVDVCVVEHNLSDWGCAISLITSITGVALACPLCPLGFVSCIACLAAGGGLIALLTEGCLENSYECDMNATYVSEGWIADWTDGEADCDTYDIANENAIVVNSMDDVGE